MRCSSRRIAVILLCAGLFLLAACQSAAPPLPSPSGAESVSPVDSPPTPSPQPGNSSTPPPAQDAPPPAQPAQEPEPSAEPEPTQEPEPSAEPDPTSEPVPPAEPAPSIEPEPVQNTRLYILMYHDVVDSAERYSPWTVSAARLRDDLQWLADHGYTTLLPSELVRADSLPERAVLITFDDGYASNYKLAFPLLREFQAKAVISLLTGQVDSSNPNYLSWDMCREMADSGLVEFGSHTYNAHFDAPPGIKRMGGESREDYQARIFPDLQSSIDLIRENLGQEVLFFAYPSGQRESWASPFLKEHFSITVTTRHGPADLSGGLYDLPRHNISMREPVSKFLPA